jgi:hypothetical protein
MRADKRISLKDRFIECSCLYSALRNTYECGFTVNNTSCVETVRYSRDIYRI